MFNDFDWNKKYLVAVSGGPDSIFLLTMLLKEAEFRSSNFIICHVNYNFRTNSKFDQSIVEKICAENNIKLCVKEIKIDYSLLKQNFESFARKARYDFFEVISQANPEFDTVLIAHNLNDLIETYLIQQQRNNIVNYFGIKEKTFYKKIGIIRPMLHLKKTEILDFLDKEKIAYAIDETNFDEKYLRNKIRKEISESEFPNILNEIKTKNLEVENDENLANQYIEENGFNSGLEISEFKKLNESVKKRILATYILNLEYSYIAINSKKSIINEILKICESEKPMVLMNKMNVTIMKDFNFLKIFNSELICPKTQKIKNYYEISEKWSLDLENKIKNLNFPLPMIITNDYIKIKNKAKFKNKYLSDLFSSRKINYFERLTSVYILDKNGTNILDIL